MITLDTSGILALLNSKDPMHREAEQALGSDAGPFIVPQGIMAEVGYMVEARLGVEALVTFLSDIEAGAYTLDCGAGDVSVIRELVTRYYDLPLGYADAAVAACAARHRGRVLTIDRRHFQVIAPEIPGCTLLPGG